VLAATVAIAAVGCGGDDQSTTTGGAGGATATATATQGGGTADTARGKQLFTQTCGGCHTLKDAGTSGQVGPNLDDLKPDKDRVLNAIKTGPGQMPQNLYQGADAEAVAQYVASAAGS
jgi:sulfite dehydrogenase